MGSLSWLSSSRYHEAGTLAIDIHAVFAGFSLAHGEFHRLHRAWSQVLEL
jgi:hypothetical protein